MEIKRLSCILIIISSTSMALAQNPPPVVDPVQEALNSALKQAVVDSAKQPAVDFIKNKINEAIFVKIGASGTSTNGAGNTMFSLIDFGMATDDYLKAENDKQRLYAGARGVNAVVTIAAPPVGAAVGVVLATVAFAESFLAASSAEEILNLRKQTMIHQEAINKILASYGQADLAYLKSINDMQIEASKKLNDVRLYLKEKCSDENKIETGDILKSCVDSVVHAAGAMKALVRLTENLLQSKMMILDKQ